VIGDVNHSGFLIGQDALVALIDADSFQFDDGTTRHLCRVGVPEYTPPELQGAVLAETPRTPDHDAFGLAVLLFQLLFLGRHPFAGISSGDPLPVAETIGQHAFAYSRLRRSVLTPPPAALHVDEVPPAVADLFERAFAPDAAGRRPTAGDWVAALDAFERALAPCPANTRHHHGASACPWCRIERTSRAPLFPAPGDVGAAPTPVARDEALARLAAIVLPEAIAYRPPPPLPSSAPPVPTVRQLWLDRLGTLGLAAMMVCAVGLVVVSPQNFLMASPICLYGIGPVGDALLPRRGARRAIAKIDRRYAELVGSVQGRADLDAAALLKADLVARAEKLAGATVRRPTPRQRAEAMRLARDVPRLEAMAEGIRALLASRHMEIDRLLAKREKLARDLEALGEQAAPLPEVAPRPLRPATRAKLGLA
jgi:DNA-binding helix-hairpin-helix protein with protein kinase domain